MSIENICTLILNNFCKNMFAIFRTLSYQCKGLKINVLLI